MTATTLRKTEMELSLFSSFIAVIIAGIYLIARMGFDDLHLQPVIETLGVSLFLLNTPAVVANKILKRGRMFTSEAFLFFSLFALLVCSGILTSYIPQITFIKWPFAVVGCALFLLQFFTDAISHRKVSYNVISFTLAVLFSLWAAVVFWGYGSRSPLYFESFAVELPHIDSLFHIAISEMIKTYGVPTTGIEGVTYYPYHFGGHFVFTQLSRLLDQELFLFYSLAFPVIFLPLVAKTFLGFVVILREQLFPGATTSLFNNFWFWLVFFAGFVGFLHVDILNDAGAASYVILLSESYSFSMILQFVFFTLLITFWKKNQSNNITSQEKALFLFLTVPALIGLIGIVKISTLFITVTVLGYSFLRLRFYRDKSIIISLTLVALVSVAIFRIAFDSKGENGEFLFFHYIKTYIHGSVIVFFIVFYVWILVLGILLFLINNGKPLKTSVANLNFFALELTLVIAIVGFLPGALLKIAGGSALYFMDPQYWIALACVLAYWSTQRNLLKNLTIPHRLIIAFLSAIAVYYVFKNTKHHSKLLVLKHISIHKNINDGTSKTFERRSLYNEIFPSDKSFFDNVENIIGQTQKSLSRDPDYLFFTSLYQLKQNLGRDKTLLFIENKHGLHTDYDCQIMALAIPALTGMATMNGVPYDYCPATEYGFEQFNLEDRKEIGRLYSDEDLCKKVGDLGFSRVIVINYNEHKINSERKVECR